MIMNRARILALRPPYLFQGVSIFFENTVIRDGVTKRSLGVNIEMQEVEENVDSAPLLEINETAAQELMDSLYRCGLRPSDAPKTGEQLAPTVRHLDDMRALVRHAYKMELPS